MELKQICKKELCTGCSACANICPKQCIKMHEDEFGAIYPYVETEFCVKCGICERVCHVINSVKMQNSKHCYAAYRKDENKRLNSASGGIAAVLYEKFIVDGGVCYGVCGTSDKVSFMRISSVDEIEAVKGSQYTQALVGNIYTQIEKDIKNELEVLFIGLPCQVAGCLNYIQSRKLPMDRLTTVDIICHGVCPQKYLNEELQYLSGKYKWHRYSKVTFRSNAKRKNYHFSVTGYGGNDRAYEYIKSADASRYFYSFLHNVALRESCYHCKYSIPKRVGDITIGDFLGLGKNPRYGEYKGKRFNTSVVLVNGENGKKLFNKITEEIEFYERDVSEAVDGAPSMHGPAVEAIKREEFISLYPQIGFVSSMNKIYGITLTYNDLKSKIKTIIKHVISRN